MRPEKFRVRQKDIRASMMQKFLQHQGSYDASVFLLKRIRTRYKKETWSRLLLVPHSEGSRIALLVETSNAESPTKMLYINLLYYRHW